MLPVHHNYHLVHLTELNVLPRLLAHPMPKLVAHQVLELELMVFVSGIQLLPHQLVDQWLVEMLLAELVLQFVQLVFLDVFQMEPNVLLKLLAQHIQPRFHAIQEDLTESVSSLPQLPLELLLELEHVRLLQHVLMLQVIKQLVLLLKIDVHGLQQLLEPMQLLASVPLIHVLLTNQLLEFVETS